MFIKLVSILSFKALLLFSCCWLSEVVGKKTESRKTKIYNNTKVKCIDTTLFRWNVEEDLVAYNVEGRFCVEEKQEALTSNISRNTINLLDLPPSTSNYSLIRTLHPTHGLQRGNFLYVTSSVDENNCKATRLDLKISDNTEFCSTLHSIIFPSNYFTQCKIPSFYCKNVNVSDVWGVLMESKRVWRVGGEVQEGFCSNQYWAPISFEGGWVEDGDLEVVVDIGWHREGLILNPLNYISQMQVRLRTLNNAADFIRSSHPHCTLSSIVTWHDVTPT